MAAMALKPWKSHTKSLRDHYLLSSNKILIEDFNVVCIIIANVLLNEVAI